MFLAAILSRIGFSSNDDADDQPLAGPDAIGSARREIRTDSRPTEATIGRPHLEDLGGQFTRDLKAVVPLHVPGPASPPPLTFDVEGDQLIDFCNAYDVKLDQIGALEGAKVPLRWDQGAPVANWRELATQGGDE
jgi:hypothetical protein